MENAEAAQSAVDFTRILETSDGDKEFEQELLTIFLEDCADRITRLNDAVRALSLKAVHLEAHTIKGACSNVGTTRLHEMASRLEKADEAEIQRVGPTLMEEIASEFQRVETTITAYLETL